MTRSLDSPRTARRSLVRAAIQRLRRRLAHAVSCAHFRMQPPERNLPSIDGSHVLPQAPVRLAAGSPLSGKRRWGHRSPAGQLRPCAPSRRAPELTGLSVVRTDTGERRWQEQL